MSVGPLHIIRPEFLLLLPLALAFWLWLNRRSTATDWHNYLPARSIAVLQVRRSSSKSLLKWALLTIWLLIILAASGPSWQKQSLPALENQRALVVLLDLSPSMRSTDVAPDRITRARFELIDVLRAFEDGQLGLVAYAGSAHIVSPLTDDANNISALVPALSPDVMPDQGSNVEAAVELAQRLLDDAGIGSGNLLLITDGVDEGALVEIRKLLKPQRSLSILGVGSDNPTPIPAIGGGFVSDSQGDIVLTQLNRASLQSLARATRGRFSQLKPDDSDTQLLVSSLAEQYQDGNSSDTNLGLSAEYDSWADKGHWLVLLVLPLFIMLFRKGVIYIALIALFLPVGFDAVAAESGWQDWFKTPDQKAAGLMRSGEFDAAANTFEREDWSAAAHYRNGEFEKAIEQLTGREDTQSQYNKATAMAMNGQLQEAVAAYDALLKAQPEHADAAHNKAFLEELIKQQQNQEQNQGDGESSESNQDQNSESEKSQQNSSEQQQSGSQSNQEQNNSESNSESQESDNQESNQNHSQSQQQNDEQSSNESQSSSDDDDTKSLSEQHQQQEESDAENEQQTEQDNNKKNKGSSQVQSQDNSDDDPRSSQQSQSAVVEQNQDSEQAADDAQSQDTVKTVTEPLSASSEQWLRGIEDDPAGLLKRKFEYQAWQRQQERKKAWQNRKNSERY